MTIKKLFVVLLALILVSPTVVVAADTQNLGSAIYANYDEDTKTIEASVMVFESGTTPGGISSKQQLQEILQSCEGETDVQKCMFEKTATLYAQPDVFKPYSLEDAQLVFKYYNPISGGFDPIEGCEDKKTALVRTVTVRDGENIQDIPYHAATCRVPDTLLQGQRKITVQVEFLPQQAQDIVTVRHILTIDSSDVTSTGYFIAAIDNLVSGMGGAVTPHVCVGVFLLMGLLIASFYFTGRSPLTLLDITTPKLPAPKGAAVSGQVVTPFGYGELKKATVAKMAVAAGAAARTAGILSRRGGLGMSNAKRRADAAIGGIKVTGADKVIDVKGEKAILKSIAMGGASVGMAWPRYAGLLKKLPKNYGNAEHKALAGVLKELEAKGGERGALLAGTIKDYFLGHGMSKQLDVLLGISPEPGKTSVLYARTMGMVNRVYGPGRYPLVGTAIGSTIGSMKRTGEMVGRGAKATGVYAGAAAGAVAERMVGRERLLRAAKKKGVSPGMAAVAGFITKKKPSQEIGQMFPIAQKMEFLYGDLRDEIRRDQLRYVLRQIFRKAGVKFDLSMDEIADMGHVDMDVLKRMGIKDNAALKAIEAEIKAVLGNDRLSSQQKLDALVAFANANGVALDNSVLSMSAELERIDNSGEPGYMKLLMLNQVLEAEHMRAKGIMEGAGAADAYICHVGLENPTGGQVWETQVLRAAIDEGANFSVEKSAIGEYLQEVNRLRGLHVGKDQLELLPEFMRNAKQQEAINKRVVGYMGMLITDDGQKMLKDLTGKTKANANIDDYMSVLFGQKAMYAKAGIRPGAEGVDISKEGVGVWWEAPLEIAPPKGAWSIDMERHWIPRLNPKESKTIGEFVENRFTRSYHPPYKAAIEAELNNRPGSGAWTVAERTNEAKKLWVKDQLAQDLNQRANSLFAANAYGGDTRDSVRTYSYIVSGNLARALKEKGLSENDPQRAFVESADLSSPKDIGKLLGILSKNKDGFEEVAKRKVTYNDVAAGGPMVMLHEGGFTYYRKGMMLSDKDRVLGGSVALRDDKGQWRSFSPSSVAVSFGNRTDLAQEHNKARASSDAKDWTNILEGAAKWAKSGGYNYEKQKVYAALLNEYGSRTGDYSRYWQEGSVKLMPTKETIPLVNPLLSMVGVEETPDKLSRYISKPWRDFKTHGGNYLSQIALATGGPVHDASYGIIPTSEYYRQHSMQLATKIFSSDMKDLTEDERLAYRQVALQHGAYHNVWSTTVDRNPWRTSAAYGSYQDLASSYQYGPTATFSTRFHFRSHMKSHEYRTFQAFYGWPMNAAGKMMRPYTTMIRGLQMSVHGYPSKWDMAEDTMRQWRYTPPRFLESMQALNPFSFAGQGKYTRKLSALNMWGGSLEKRQLAGADFQQGLGQSPSEIFLTQKGGVYATAREGMANPGLNYLDYRYRTHLDPAQAEFLFRTGQATYVHDEEVRRQAFSNINRRTVRAEALAMRRAEELRGYGMAQNPLWGWANPVFFAWHMPLPFVPPSVVPKDMLASAVSSYKYGRRSYGQSLAEIKRKTGGAASRFMQPWRGTQVAYCPVCSTPSYHGGRCKNPQCRHYIY